MFNFNYNNNRIIAIGDIHGDYLIFIELLKLAKVIDDNFNWIGNDTFVIQLGDTLDGKRPNIKIDNDFLNTTGEIEITELILKLDKKAKIYGGRVISILGNHELYPYYFNNDKSFNDKYVKKVDLKEYKKRFKMDRFKYYQPGNPGAILLGKTRPLIIQLGKFIFTHGSLNIGFVRGCLENKLNIIGDQRMEKIKKNYGSDDYKNANKDLRDTLVQAVNHNMSEILPKINTHVQLVYGEYDLIAPLENGKIADNLIPDSELTVLLKENHFCLDTSKDQIIEIIKR